MTIVRVGGLAKRALQALRSSNGQPLIGDNIDVIFKIDLY